jgi:transposase
MPEPTLCCSLAGGYCDRCDLLVGLGGLRVIAVERDDDGELRVSVESEPGVMGCPTCGVLAHGHGRVLVRLVDAPWAGAPVTILWRKRRWVCPDGDCARRSFVEQDEQVAAGAAHGAACRWAIAQLRREHASVAGLARQLGTTLDHGVDLDRAGAGGGRGGPGPLRGGGRARGR